jgi:hypothetical protein
MSVFGKRQSTNGPGHDGGPKSGFYAKPGKPGLDVHHDPMDARKGDKPGSPAHEQYGHRGHPTGAVVYGETVRAPGALDIQPRQGAAKRLDPVAPHSSSTARQLAGSGRGGMGHGSAVLSGGEVVATNAAAVPPVPAHRRGFNSPAAPSVPITHAYGTMTPKIREAAPVKAGMRSRTGPLARSLTDSTPHSILGRAIIDEAKR